MNSSLSVRIALCMMACGFLFSTLIHDSHAEEYEITMRPGDEAAFESVEYKIWIADETETVRGILVHQHGCGEGASNAGKTATYDLQWRELARKWDFALVGSSYQQKDACPDWCDPGNGSEITFLAAIDFFAHQSGHTEMITAPWVLWGHSGGGFWVYSMMQRHPDNILALVLQSPSFSQAELAAHDIGLDVPTLCILGMRESYDRFSNLWCRAIDVSKERIAKGGRYCLAPDPSSSHDCKHARLLSIPFIDTCLRTYFGEGWENAQPVYAHLNHLAILKNMPQTEEERNHTSWMPTREFATQWQEFVKTGWVIDKTPPNVAPFDIDIVKVDGDTVKIEWDARADVESGIHSFIVYRNEEKLAEVTGEKSGQNPEGDLLYHNYSDTPPAEPIQMHYIDGAVQEGNTYTYQIAVVNRSGLESEKSQPHSLTIR